MSRTKLGFIFLALFFCSWLRADFPFPYQTETSFILPNPISDSYFGRTLKQDGEWCVSYVNDHENGNFDIGALFVYRRVSGQWTFFQKIKSTSGVLYSYLGDDYALSGNRLVSHYYNANTGNLEFYEYEFDGVTWVLRNIVDLDDGIVGEMNLSHMDLQGDELFFCNRQPANSSPPHIAVYTKSAGSWTLTQQIQSPESGLTLFPRSVDVDGDLVAVMAKNALNKNRVFLFRKIQGTWTYESQLAPSDESTVTGPANYGRAFHIDGESIAVSNISRNVGVFIAAGSVYVYKRIAGQWTETQIIENPGPNSGGSEWFGYSLDMEDGVLAVGALNDAPDNVLRSGSVYVYKLGVNGVWEPNSWFAPSVLSSAHDYGNSVALDGRDLFVGAPLTPGAVWGGIYLNTLPLNTPRIQSALLFGTYKRPEGVVTCTVSDFDPTNSTFVLQRLFGTVWGEVDRELALTNAFPELVEPPGGIREAVYSYRVQYITPTPETSRWSTTFVATPAADLDRDGDIDKTDRKIMLLNVGRTTGSPGWNPQADLIRNGVIDNADVVAFDTWLYR